MLPGQWGVKMAQIKSSNVVRKETLTLVVSINLTDVKWYDVDRKIDEELKSVEMPVGDWNIVQRKDGSFINNEMEVIIVLEREI